MEKFRLESPTIEREKDAIDYINEHYEYNSKINGVGGLKRYLEDYKGWLNKLENDRNIIPSEEKVPSETFFLIREDDDRLIGMINIRLTLNTKLRRHGGHIGYGIRPTERRKGYNKINLYLGLLKCQKYGIKKAMLSCDKDNLGSSKTIQALCGELEKEYFDDEENKMIEIYWIDVDYAIEKKNYEYIKYIS